MTKVDLFRFNPNRDKINFTKKMLNGLWQGFRVEWMGERKKIASEKRRITS